MEKNVQGGIEDMSKKILVAKGHFGNTEEQPAVCGCEPETGKCTCEPDCDCGCDCCPSVRQKLVLWYPLGGK